MHSLISFDDALQHITDEAPAPSDDVRSVPIADALNHVLAADIISEINVPPADNSAMDGYAIKHSDLMTDTVTNLPISQRIPAGRIGTPLKAGTVARIFTGAFMPKGADTVIMQEKVTVSDSQAVIADTATLGQHIRRAGEDIAIGQTILAKGKKLTAADIGLAASIGITTLSVYPKITVAVMCTGDELVEPGQPLAPGQIYNSNRYTLTQLLNAMGCDIIDLGIIADNAQITEKTLLEAAQKADVIISSGGVSVGEEDHVKNVLEKLGQLKLWKIAVKPGKPLAFGQIEDTPFIGLPGNPVSSFATFCLFARPFILKMQGHKTLLPNTYSLPLAIARPKAGSRREFIRVKRITTKDGISALEALPHQGSGVLSSVSGSDGFAVIMEHQTYNSGDPVTFIPYSEITG